MKPKGKFAVVLLWSLLLSGCSGDSHTDADSYSNLREELPSALNAVQLSKTVTDSLFQQISTMSEEEFDEFLCKIISSLDETSDSSRLKTNLAYCGVEFEQFCTPNTILPNYICQLFYAQRTDQTMRHLYFHVYSTEKETSPGDIDCISFSFDPTKVSFHSTYSSSKFASLADASRYKDGYIDFNYEDINAVNNTESSKWGEALVGLHVIPATDHGTVAFSAAFCHNYTPEFLQLEAVDGQINFSATLFPEDACSTVTVDGFFELSTAPGVEPPIEETTNDPWGLILTAKNSSEVGLTLVCTQSGGNVTGELMTGTPYWLERWENDAWVPVETVPSKYERTWTDVGYVIPLGGHTEFDGPINWERLYGKLPDGFYRIGKRIQQCYEPGSAPGAYEEQEYYAQFLIN